MNFKDEIEKLESLELNDEFVIKKGSIPILFNAPHTIQLLREDGSIKLSEPYTKAIALYLNDKYDVSCMVNLNQEEDPNKDNHDRYKIELLRFIKDNNIRLIIDLHGADINRDFDVELGTMNNLSADYSTINELKEAFEENGITNILINDPFKGGAITQYIYGIEDVDVVQIEINKRYRDIDNIENLEQFINCLAKFIELYKSK